MPPPRSNKEQVLVVRGKRYRVMKRLGKGGSSIVYEALDEEKNIVVAIKRVDLSDVDEAQKAGDVSSLVLPVPFLRNDLFRICRRDQPAARAPGGGQGDQTVRLRECGGE